MRLLPAAIAYAYAVGSSRRAATAGAQSLALCRLVPCCPLFFGCPRWEAAGVVSVAHACAAGRLRAAISGAAAGRRVGLYHTFLKRRHRSLHHTTTEILPLRSQCPQDWSFSTPDRPLFHSGQLTACFQSTSTSGFGQKNTTPRHRGRLTSTDGGRDACRHHAAPAAGRLGFAREPASALSWWLGGSQRGERTAYSLYHQSSALRQASHRPGAPSQDAQLDHVPALRGSLISRRIAVAARRSVAAAKLPQKLPQAHCQIS
jgi:hypothetical protein